jgi:hypothetical protein
MRAYDLAMVLIFVNCAFAVIAGMLPSSTSVIPGSTDGFATLSTWFSGEAFNIAGVSVNTMTLLAVLFAAGTIVVMNSNLKTDKGWSYTIFTAVFWGSWTTTSIIIGNLLNDYRVGLGVFYVIFLIASLLIFINALIQISTGGQQAHV